MQNFMAVFTVPSRNSHLQANDELYRIYFFIKKVDVLFFVFKGFLWVPGVPGDPQGPPGPSKTLQTMKKHEKKIMNKKLKNWGPKWVPNGSPMGPQWECSL